jgi:hypothetical protein
MLTQESFESSRRFIQANARPLEISRFHHAFDGAASDHVFDALGKYQNADGGFGHALEPDLRTDESSVLCTSIAFQVIRSTHAKPDDGILTASIAYLLETLNTKIGHWRIIPRSAQQSPHAPWWNETEGEDVFDSFSLNPTAEILGYLYDCQSKVPGDVLSLVTEKIIGHLVNIEEIKMHELLSCLRLLQTKNLPAEVGERIRQQITPHIDKTVEYDPAQWREYSLRPLQVVEDPSSPFMASREEAVAANLDYEIASQHEDGSWTPTWSWEGVFPNEWTQACREWTGVITLEKLLLLKRFKRIEGFA